MKLIKPSYEILDQKPGLEGIYEQIELAGRTCYKSVRKEGTTAEDFVDRMIASQHYAMLEHGTVYLYSTYDVSAIGSWRASIGRRYSENKYSVVNTDGKMDLQGIYVTTNLRVLVENDWLDDLKYLCEPTEFHEKRVTVRFTTSNGIMREFTRHRSHSFAIESTRYCNYSKDKFNNEITFIEPFWYDRQSPTLRKDLLISGLREAEKHYLALIEAGCKPQEAREVLPLATKCDMVMTGFVSDWSHFFRLRTSIIAETGKPHPDASALADPLYKDFIARGYMESLV